MGEEHIAWLLNTLQWRTCFSNLFQTSQLRVSAKWLKKLSQPSL